ncbi:MAG: hypothetical protein ACE5KD_03220 [Candidatus Bathyarchaeia archaeon]
MPTIAPSYIYSFFALVAVSSILISSFAAYATTLRTIPEMEQVENLLNHVASKGYELIILTITANTTSEAILLLPSTIGNKHYWIRLRNESLQAWVEGALGSILEGSITNRVYLPKRIFAFGNYSSGHGPALLECYMNGSTVNLYLTSWGENG